MGASASGSAAASTPHPGCRGRRGHLVCAARGSRCRGQMGSSNVGAANVSPPPQKRAAPTAASPRHFSISPACFIPCSIPPPPPFPVSLSLSLRKRQASCEIQLKNIHTLCITMMEAGRIMIHRSGLFVVRLPTTAGCACKDGRGVSASFQKSREKGKKRV